MNTPRLLIPAALIFWGWQAGAMLFALLMAFALELPRYVSTRWEFSAKEYNRMWDLCCLLFLGAALYCYASRGQNNVVIGLLDSLNWTERNRHMKITAFFSLYFFQWWPMIFFPFALAQAWGSRDRQPASTFFYFMRRRERLSGATLKGGVNVGHIYLAIVLLAAAATTHRDFWFYAGFSAIAIWTLWFMRPRRFSAVLWGSLLIVVVWGGHWSHQRLHRLQSQLEDGIMQMVSQWVNKQADPLKSHTAIGQIGELKLSGKIILRVEQDEGPVPGLILDSSYSVYHSPNWYAGREKEFESVTAENDTTTWTLGDIQAPTNSVRISGYLNGSDGILTMPPGSWQLAELIVGEVKHNRYGVVQVLDGPRLVQYRARHGKGPTPELAPVANVEGDLEDLLIPERELPAIERVGQRLRLRQRPTIREKLATIRQFFSRDFAYSTYQDISADQLPAGVTPLANFLENTRSGHCEYYGTATVLLLRYAGIPARYANGFSVHEVEEEEDRRFIVRERHGHAWAIHWSEDERRWREIDTTPPSWTQIEDDANASLFEPISDFFNRLKFAISSWWWSSRDGRFQQYLAGALVLMVAFLFWRLIRRRRKGPIEDSIEDAAPRADWPGMDSDFYEILSRLESAGLSRYPGETVGRWLNRLRDVATRFEFEPLQFILKLHYRYRFDPIGITEQDKVLLKNKTAEWLQTSGTSTAP